MTKYEQKVRERAVEFANVDNPGSWLGEDECIIPKYYNMARLSLQREAEAYREAWRQSQYFTPDYSFVELDKQLQSLGLVP